MSACRLARAIIRQRMWGGLARLADHEAARRSGRGPPDLGDQDRRVVAGRGDDGPDRAQEVQRLHLVGRVGVDRDRVQRRPGARVVHPLDEREHRVGAREGAVRDPGGDDVGPGVDALDPRARHPEELGVGAGVRTARPEGRQVGLGPHLPVADRDVGRRRMGFPVCPARPVPAHQRRGEIRHVLRILRRVGGGSVVARGALDRKDGGYMRTGRRCIPCDATAATNPSEYPKS